MKLLVFSPHLDDGILSCGQFICTQDSTVCTLLAGIPEGESNVARRRLEDERACAAVGAEYIHVNILETQYDQTDRRAAVRKWIKATAAAVQPHVAMAPLGIKHVDHEMVSDVFCDLIDEIGAECWLYEELPYRALEPDISAERRRVVRDKLGFAPKIETLSAGPLWRKQAAVACYESQYITIEPDIMCCWIHERYWKLAR